MWTVEEWVYAYARKLFSKFMLFPMVAWIVYCKPKPGQVALSCVTAVVITLPEIKLLRRMLHMWRSTLNHFLPMKAIIQENLIQNRKYLSPDLSIAKMYALYKQKCTPDSKQHVSDWVYRRIFNEEYNLTFGRYVSYGFPANFFCVLISLFYPFSLACFFHATPLLTKSLSSHFVSLSLTHLLTFSLAPPLAHAISHFSTHFMHFTCIL